MTARLLSHSLTRFSSLLVAGKKTMRAPIYVIILISLSPGNASATARDDAILIDVLTHRLTSAPEQVYAVHDLNNRLHSAKFEGTLISTDEQRVHLAQA